MIFSDPNFKGVGGNFDPARFQATIRQFGFTEQRYIADQRRVSLRRQIAGTITAGLEPPKTMIEALSRFQNEQRSIEYVKLDAAQAGTIDPPSPETLAGYFDDHKTQFRAPEYRKIAFVAITPGRDRQMVRSLRRGRQEAVRGSAATSSERRKNAKYRRSYSRTSKKPRRRAAASPPECRSTIWPRSAGSVLPTSISASITKSAIIDPAVADAAFSLALRRSQPAGARQVRRCPGQDRQDRAGRRTSYESVAASLKKEIATERARSQVADLRDKMEDERGGGASVIEAAQKLGLTAVTIDAVDRSGRAPTASWRPTSRRVSTSCAGLRQRCRRRQRSDLVQRRLCLVRRSRHHPVARAQP